MIAICAFMTMTTIVFSLANVLVAEISNAFTERLVD
jgi:hypothetical protein